MTYLTIIIYKLSLLSYESVGFLIHFKILCIDQIEA